MCLHVISTIVCCWVGIFFIYEHQLYVLASLLFFQYGSSILCANIGERKSEMNNIYYLLKFGSSQGLLFYLHVKSVIKSVLRNKFDIDGYPNQVCSKLCWTIFVFFSNFQCTPTQYCLVLVCDRYLAAWVYQQFLFFVCSPLYLFFSNLTVS